MLDQIAFLAVPIGLDLGCQFLDSVCLRSCSAVGRWLSIAHSVFAREYASFVWMIVCVLIDYILENSSYIIVFSSLIYKAYGNTKVKVMTGYIYIKFIRTTNQNRFYSCAYAFNM